MKFWLFSNLHLNLAIRRTIHSPGKERPKSDNDWITDCLFAEWRIFMPNLTTEKSNELTWAFLSEEASVPYINIGIHLVLISSTSTALFLAVGPPSLPITQLAARLNDFFDASKEQAKERELNRVTPRYRTWFTHLIRWPALVTKPKLGLSYVEPILRQHDLATFSVRHNQSSSCSTALSSDCRPKRVREIFHVCVGRCCSR